MLKLFRFLARESSWRLLVAIGAGFAAGASNVILIALINAGAGSAATPGLLLPAFLLVLVILPVARFTSRYVMLRVSQRAVDTLQGRLCAQILRAPLRDIEEIGVDRLVAALSSDLSTVTASVNSLAAMATNGIIVVACLIYLGWLSVPLLLITLVALTFQIGTFELLHRRARVHLRASVASRDRLYKHYRALVAGAKELKLHRRRRGAFLTDSIGPDAMAVTNHKLLGQAIFSAAVAAAQFEFLALLGFVAFVGGWLLSLDATTLIAASLTIIYLGVNADALFTLPDTFSRALISLRNLEELGLKLDGVVAEQDGLRSEPPAWRTIELKGVTFAYPDDVGRRGFRLGPIDLLLHRNEIVFLVGGNGSGKTTLAKLLTGLYAPNSGAVYVDGRPVDPSATDDFRQMFSAVFADFHLFDTLLGFDRDGLEDRVRERLERFGLRREVAVRDGRYSTTDLSRGQSRRLALVTAWLENRPIYLFDEWAADQDPQFREVFYRELLPELKRSGRTVVVISHDERYYDVAERIVKLQEGRIAASDVTPAAVVVPA